MSVQMDPPRSPVPAVAQVLAEAALQRQNMLLGTDKDRPVAPPAAPGQGTPVPAAGPLSKPPLPEGAADAPQAARVSLSPQASQALQAQARGQAPVPRQAEGAPAARGAGATSTSAALASASTSASTSALGAATQAGWPASGVSPAMRGLLDALVQQLTPSAPQRVVVAQPGGHVDGGAVGSPAEADLPPLQTWLVGQGQVLTEQGARSFTATLRVPAAWLQGLPQAASSSAEQPAASGSSALQAAFAGRAQALAGGVFALVLQPGAGVHGAGGASTSALLSLELAPWAGALGGAGALVYGRDQLQARNDPWLQMLALQASGYGREEEDADQRRRARGHCDAPGCPYAGRAPCEQPFCLAQRVVPVQGVSSSCITHPSE